MGLVHDPKLGERVDMIYFRRTKWNNLRGMESLQVLLTTHSEVKIGRRVLSPLSSWGRKDFDKNRNTDTRRLTTYATYD